VLATLTLEEQERELVESKRRLEEVLGQPVRTLAYPVGGYEHFHAETRDLARRCGYQAAFSFHTGVNKLHSAEALDPFDLKRIAAPLELPFYPGIFALPRLFAPRMCERPKPTPYFASQELA
jgi:peptidoglycan/xylan/chitin deacetylase (PgdA/CDA1 family)